MSGWECPADPFYCDREHDDFTLHTDSPCAPGENPTA
jgi:hypothetical protein